MCFSIIWDWLGKNAGQIQIIIAIVALILAYIVYQRVLEQIKLAKDQAIGSIEQTKHFANQVEIAGKQFEASNNQISELIENRKLLLDIRNGELKSDYLQLCIKTIELIHQAIDSNTKHINYLRGYMGLYNCDVEVKNQININIERIEKELEELKNNIQKLLNTSVSLESDQNEVSNDYIQQQIFRTNLLYLSVIRELNHNANFVSFFQIHIKP